MLEILSYEFMQRAFIASILISIVASIIGIFVVTRKMAFLGDGLSHIAFASFALALLVSINPLFAAFVVVLASGLLINRIRRAGISTDAVIGIFFSFGMALGIIMLSIAKAPSQAILFGSILSISDGDLVSIAAFSIIALAFLARYLNDFFLIAFDEELAKVRGVDVSLLNKLFIGLIAVAIVISIKIIGVLLVSALLVIPPSTALLLKRDFKITVAFSVLFALFSAIVGLFASFYLDLPSGASIVATSSILFLLVYIVNPGKE